MAFVAPTTKDVSRSIARLDENASAVEGDIVTIDGENWTGLDLRMSVANCLGFTIRHTVIQSRLTKRDVSLMLAAHGASSFTIDKHARAIASLMRSDLGMHSWSGSI